MPIFIFEALFNIFIFAELYTDYGREPGPAIINYKLLKAAVLNIAETFEVERAFAYQVDIFDLRTPSPNIHAAFPISWMSYVAPRLAHLVTHRRLPLSSIGRTTACNGRTDDVFDVWKHLMSVAHDIAAGAKALDGQLWEPE